MTSPEPLTTVSLSDPGDLIAISPVLLGFVPRSSLIAMALGGASGRRLGLTLRIDLPPPEHIAPAAEDVVRGILLDHPAAVVLVVVGPGGDAGPPAFAFVEQVTAGLAEHAVEACHALWTESTAAGSRWRCYGECACTGVVPRSSASPLAAAARAEGRVVRADREEIERLVAPVDESVLRRREALLIAAVDAEADAAFAAFGDTGPAVSSADGRGGAGECGIDQRTEAIEGAQVIEGAEVVEGLAALDAALDAAQEAVAGAADGDLPANGGDAWLDDVRAVAVVRALQIPVVRDAAVAACTGTRPAAAEALWAALARGTPDPEAAEPAALLALMGLLHGDGALANVALRRAEDAWPGHHLTATLRGLAAAGIRPSELRACLIGAPQPGLRPPPRPRSQPAGRRRARTPRPARRHRRRR
jgi:Domain of unknown function (DUF4192)